MKTIARIFTAGLIAVSSLVTLSACSQLIYTPTINQGVQIDKAQTEQIKVGQTKEQVFYLLGSPTQFTSLSSDAWYFTSRVIDSRGHTELKTFVVIFKDNKVVSSEYKE